MALVAASLPHACGTLPSGCAAISLVIWINRFVSRLSPKSALPNSSCAQLSALVILLVLRRPYLPLPYFSLILLFFTLPLLLSMSIVLLIIYHRTSGLVGNDKHWRGSPDTLNCIASLPLGAIPPFVLLVPPLPICEQSLAIQVLPPFAWKYKL